MPNLYDVPVGTLLHSFLTTAQFQKEAGTNWVLCDGQSVTGSAYETITGNSSVPDVRGHFLRAKDHGSGNNPDGDLAIAASQGSQFGSHTHSSKSNVRVSGGTQPTSEIQIDAGLTTDNTWQNFLQSFGEPTDATGGNETRPINITVNVFIRID